MLKRCTDLCVCVFVFDCLPRASTVQTSRILIATLGMNTGSLSFSFLNGEEIEIIQRGSVTCLRLYRASK